MTVETATLTSRQQYNTVCQLVQGGTISKTTVWSKERHIADDNQTHDDERFKKITTTNQHQNNRSH